MRHIVFYVILFLFVAVKPIHAQLTFCDSLEIVNVEYWPFADSVIAVYVDNQSSNLFAYPGFVLFDANGDTVAKEIVNYFGIGPFDQVHLLQVKQGVQVQESFSGTLELWSGFYSNMECTYNKQIELCPDTTCTEIFLNLANNGGAIAIATFTWDIKNLAGAVQYSGTMELTGTQQHDVDSLCLPYGSYIIEFNSAQQPMGQVWATTYTGIFYPNGPGGQFIINNTILDLDFYEACFDPNSIEEPTNTLNIQAFVNNDLLHISNLKGKAIGNILIYDAIGRLIIKEQSQKSTAQIDLSKYPPAAFYLLSIHKGKESYSQKFYK